MGWVFISSSEWKEEIPTFSFTVLLKSWQTYDGFAFVFYYFSPHYFYHQKAAQRQHCDTAEWSLGTKAYTFPRYGRCVISLWWEHTLPKVPKKVFLTLYLVARRQVLDWISLVWRSCEGWGRKHGAGKLPKSWGAWEVHNFSRGENPKPGRAEHGGDASRGFGQCSLARIAGEMCWVSAGPPQKLLHLLYNIIACFIDIHSKAVYNTIVRHIFGEIWYVVKKCSKTEVYKNN